MDQSRLPTASLVYDTIPAFTREKDCSVFKDAYVCH